MTTTTTTAQQHDSTSLLRGLGAPRIELRHVASQIQGQRLQGRAQPRGHVQQLVIGDTTELHASYVDGAQGLKAFCHRFAASRSSCQASSSL